MPELTSACGLDCARCEAYNATLNNDTAAREEIACNWSEMYGRPCTADDCICEGCKSDGLLSTAHAATCEIRICVEDNDIPNCAHCENYPCEKLEEFLEFVPEARRELQSIRSDLEA